MCGKNYRKLEEYCFTVTYYTSLSPMNFFNLVMKPFLGFGLNSFINYKKRSYIWFLSITMLSSNSYLLIFRINMKNRSSKVVLVTLYLAYSLMEMIGS